MLQATTPDTEGRCTHADKLYWDGSPQAEHWTAKFMELGACNHHDIEEAVDVSNLMADKMGKAQQQQGARAFCSWMGQALQGGGGAAHRWTTRELRPPPLITEIKGDKLDPILPDQLMDLRRSQWAGRWTRYSDQLKDFLGKVLNLRDKCKHTHWFKHDLTMHDLEKGLDKFKKGTAIGIGQWRPSEVRAIPTEGK